MNTKLESFLGFITGFVVSIASMAFYRHQTVFAELCQRTSNKQLPEPSTGIGTCLNFEQVVIATAINPIYLVVSFLVGFSIAILLWKR
jgi:multisubunit Na+/H+ antiporter MnhG subunit